MPNKKSAPIPPISPIAKKRFLGGKPNEKKNKDTNKKPKKRKVKKINKTVIKNPPNPKSSLKKLNL